MNETPQNNFYVQLFSNAVTDDDHENHLDHFTNYFPEPLILPARHNWGVALHALFMPNSPAYPPIASSDFGGLIKARLLGGGNTVKVLCPQLQPNIGGPQPLSVHTRKLYDSNQAATSLHVHEPIRKHYFRVNATYLQCLTIQLTDSSGHSLKIATSQPTAVILEFKRMTAGETYTTLITTEDNRDSTWAETNTNSNFRLSLPAELSPPSEGNSAWEVALAALTYEPYFDQLEEIKQTKVHVFLVGPLSPEQIAARREKLEAREAAMEDEEEEEEGEEEEGEGAIVLVDLPANPGLLGPDPLYFGQQPAREEDQANSLGAAYEAGEEGSDDSGEEEAGEYSVEEEEDKAAPRNDTKILHGFRIRGIYGPVKTKTFFQGDWRGGSKYSAQRPTKWGYYRGNGSIVRHLQKYLAQACLELDIEIEVKTKHGHVALRVQNNAHTSAVCVFLSWKLGGMLGVRSQMHPDWRGDETVGYLRLNTRRTLYGHARVNVNIYCPENIQIYANFVEPSVVGNVKTSILKSVPVIRNDENGFLHYEPRHLEFRRLTFSHLMNLHFQLLSADGKEIKFAFEDSPVHMLLEFRKKI
jgi:hypothetical protein